jgi:predicted secreted protein
MPWALGIAVFVIIWWVLFFAILPFGVKSQHEAESMVEGTDPGAPIQPHLGLKLLVNTVLAALLWAIANWAYIRYFLEAQLSP